MSPIATIPPSHFADLFNSHLLRPIQTIQVFLPLLTTMTASPPPAPPSSPSTGTSGSTTAGGSPSEKRGSADAPKVVVFTPSLAASTSPPFHAPEATVCSALSAFTEVLAAELRPLSIPVVHVQLGGIGATGVDASTSAYTAAGGDHPRREMTAMATWTQQERAAYGGNFRRAALAVAGSRPHPLLWPFTTSSTSSASASASASASLRDLHRAVFDALRSEPQVTSAAAPTLSVVHVGLGAGFYSTVGRWMPPSLIGWFLGGADRRVDLTAVARATGDLERGLVVVPPGGRSRRAGGGGASGSEGLSDISPSPYPTPGSVSGDDEDEEEKAARRLRDVLDSVPDDGERWATQ